MAMEHNASVSWPEQLSEETLMATGNEDDFSSFLEFGIDFADLEGHNPASVQHQRAMQHPDNHVPTSIADDSRVDADHPAQASPYASVVGNHLAMGIPNNNPIDDQAFHFSHEQQQQQQQQHQHQHQQRQMAQHSHPQLAHQHSQHHPEKYPPHTYPDGQHVIPPTPNSIELHGGAARYPQRVDMGNEMYDRYGQMNDDQAAFYTPLVSPAMTPLETQFRLPEYTIPGEYFTPLTSPALEAQNSNSNGYPFTTQPPSTHSQMDPNGISMTSVPSSPAAFRRQQRRRPSTATRAGGRASKASPSIQPKNWRKQTVNTQLVADDLAAALGQEQAPIRPPTSGGSSLRYSGHDSSQDSVSPEPISEPLMPPPAIPQTRKSPAFRPQGVASDTSAPATPATLMKITNRPQHTQEPSGQFSGLSSLVTSEPQDELMEDVVLPEAATDTRPRPSRIDTAINTKDSQSTPSVEPKSASERPASGSLTPAPHSGAMPSPSGPIPKKSDSKASTGRKRQSVSSSHVSPALRPRISPSIQPLVRGDGMTSESSALYLASKSNYQHILDGTVLPGVSYPDTLAENLSSKRTNHKLAEQGRRNRINSALKEIEALLPPGFARERAAKEGKDGTAGATKNGDKEKEKSAQQTISKATTVEMAIDYIKTLKKELEETKAQLNVAVSKLATQNSSSPSDDGKNVDVTSSVADKAT